VCLFPSYREAELRGYYSLKRLRQMGLEVRERKHWNYLYMVAPCHGNLPVYSKEQARDSHTPDPVPGPREAPSPDPIGVGVLLPEEEPTTSRRAALCGQNCPPTGSSRQTGPTETKRRTRGRAKPRSTGYFIDTPEDLDVPESHKDAENEIRLILHVVKSGIDRHGHQVEGVAHYNHPLGKRLMGGRAESKAYKWLIDSNVLICADHRYSHRPDDPKSSFSKSYYVHSRHGKWRKWEITKPRLAAKLLLAQSQRTDLKSPKRQTDTELTANVHVALCGLIRPSPESSTITDPVMDHLVRQNLDLGIDMDKAQKILDEHPEADRKKAMATARKVGDPKASYEVCDYGRFHAPITRLFSPLREAVFFNSRPDARKVGWDLRNSQILHLVKAFKEDRYEARAGSRSAEPFFNEREEEFFRLVEEGQVYDSCFARAQQDCPEYLTAKIRRTKQKATWAEL
jgi:hypothetical protein